jgi:hypothetical protein
LGGWRRRIVRRRGVREVGVRSEEWEGAEGDKA